MKLLKNARFVKAMIVALAVLLSLVLAVGGTVAWLIDTTDSVVNTFTVGDINITLAETTGEEYKMIPGSEIAKDPKVTVLKGSEACWLFVKVEEANNIADETTNTNFFNYQIADGWTELADVTGVYYRKVEAATAADASFYVLADADTNNSAANANGSVKVPDTVTKEMFEKITNAPTLTFTAYAVQKDNVANAATAWALANPTT